MGGGRQRRDSVVADDHGDVVAFLKFAIELRSEVDPTAVGEDAEDVRDIVGGRGLAGALPLVVAKDAVGEAGIVTGVGVHRRDLDDLVEGV